MAASIEVGSTNVYADLGYEDAAQMQRKATLASEIARAIAVRHLSHDAAAQLLGINSADIASITRGQFRGVSEATMLEMAARLSG